MITAALALVLTNNILLSVAKWLGQEAMTKVWLRALLALLSIIGVVSTASLSGSAVDYDSISQWVKLIAEIVGIALGSHLSYKAIKNA